MTTKDQYNLANLYKESYENDDISFDADLSDVKLTYNDEESALIEKYGKLGEKLVNYFHALENALKNPMTNFATIQHLTDKINSMQHGMRMVDSRNKVDRHS
jgi:replicative superfamily II helicase